MKTLRNRTIFIGRDPEKPQLMAFIEINSNMKRAIIGETQNIPTSVSRCKVSDKLAHCKIDFDADGEMTLTNLRDTNETYVDGQSIVSKRIMLNSAVALGCDRYPIDINKIVAAIKTTAGVDISPLEEVWNNYQTDMEAIAKAQQERNRRRMLPMLVGFGSGVLAAVLGALKLPETFIITIPVTIISFVICFKNYREKDTSIEERKAVNDKFLDDYSCPACGHFMGNQPYKILRQNSRCPYCHADFLK